MLDYRIHFAQLVAEDRLRERRGQAQRPTPPQHRIFRIGTPSPSRRASR